MQQPFSLHRVYREMIGAQARFGLYTSVYIYILRPVYSSFQHCDYQARARFTRFVHEIKGTAWGSLLRAVLVRFWAVISLYYYSRSTEN